MLISQQQQPQHNDESRQQAPIINVENVSTTADVEQGAGTANATDYTMADSHDQPAAETNADDQKVPPAVLLGLAHLNDAPEQPDGALLERVVSKRRQPSKQTTDPAAACKKRAEHVESQRRQLR